MTRIMALLLIVPLLLLLLAGRVVFRVALRLGLAASLAGVAGVVLSLLLGQGAGIAILLAVLLFVPTLLLLARFAPRRRRPVPRVAPAAIPSAWDQLRRAAPAARRPLLKAEQQCADFLRLAEAQGAAPETVDLQILVEKRVPEIMRHGLARALLANDADRRRTLDETVASVLEVAAAAEAERARLWQSGGDHFAAQRAHLANRVRPGPLSSV